MEQRHTVAFQTMQLLWEPPAILSYTVSLQPEVTGEPGWRRGSVLVVKDYRDKDEKSCFYPLTYRNDGRQNRHDLLFTKDANDTM